MGIIFIFSQLIEVSSKFTGFRSSPVFLHTQNRYWTTQNRDLYQSAYCVNIQETCLDFDQLLIYRAGHRGLWSEVRFWQIPHFFGNVSFSMWFTVRIGYSCGVTWKLYSLLFKICIRTHVVCSVVPVPGIVPSPWHSPWLYRGGSPAHRTDVAFLMDLLFKRNRSRRFSKMRQSLKRSSKRGISSELDVE